MCKFLYLERKILIEIILICTGATDVVAAISYRGVEMSGIYEHAI